MVLVQRLVEILDLALDYNIKMWLKLKRLFSKILPQKGEPDEHQEHWGIGA